MKRTKGLVAAAAMLCLSICSALSVMAAESDLFYDISPRITVDVSNGSSFYCSEQDSGEGRYLAACLRELGVTETAFFGLEDGRLVACDENASVLRVVYLNGVYELSSSELGTSASTAEDIPLPAVTLLLRSQTDQSGNTVNYYDRAEPTLTVTYSISDRPLDSSSSQQAAEGLTDPSASDTVDSGSFTMPLYIKLIIAGVILSSVAVAAVLLLKKGGSR